MRHLSLTIANTPEGMDLLKMLEHEFRPFDYKALEPRVNIWICRWHRVSQANCALLSKSIFLNEIVGSITLSKLEEPSVARREVQDSLGVGQTVGVSIVRARRLAE